MIKRIKINNFVFETWNNCVLENAWFVWLDFWNRSTYDFPYWNWIWIQSNNFWWNTFRINWLLKWTDKFELNNIIDSFWQNICIENWFDIEVKIEISTWVYKYLIWKWILNTQQPIIREWNMINYCLFNFDILIQNWCLNDSVSDSITFSWWEIYNFVWEWQYKTYPIITVTCQLWSANTIKFKSWNEYIELIWPFAQWTIITIDCINKEVRNWTTLIDYKGIFPYIIPWNNAIETVWTWCSLQMEYYPSYII